MPFVSKLINSRCLAKASMFTNKSMFSVPFVSKLINSRCLAKASMFTNKSMFSVPFVSKLINSRCLAKAATCHLPPSVQELSGQTRGHTYLSCLMATGDPSPAVSVSCRIHLDIIFIKDSCQLNLFVTHTNRLIDIPYSG